MRHAQMPAATQDALQMWLSRSLDRDSEPDMRLMPELLSRFVRDHLLSTKGLDSDLASELERCFGLSDGIDILIRWLSQGGISFAISTTTGSAAEAESAIKYHFRFERGQSETKAQIPTTTRFAITEIEQLRDGDLLPPRFLLDRDTDDDFFKLYMRDFIATLVSSQMNRIVGPFAHNAYYLPADRTGVMHAHRVVVSSLIDQAATGGLRPTRDLPMLSGVLADFLRQVIETSSGRRRHQGEHATIAQHVETAMLEGSIRGDSSEFSYPTFYYQPNGWKHRLPLANSSSMVSELAPVVLYLRHYVATGDTLIIEEPESHLHPEAQAAFAVVLGHLVNAGVRVLVTTHSDWLLEQFANLVRMTELSKEERTGLIDADAAIPAKDFGAWRFIDHGAQLGTVVEEIDINPEEGGLVRDYRQVLDETYNLWAEIGNRIAEREE